MATAEIVARTGPSGGNGAGVREAAARRESRPARAAAPETGHPAAWQGEDRYRLIAEAAYFRAEQRGFVPGDELADWLAAEIEVDDLLAAANAIERT